MELLNLCRPLLDLLSERRQRTQEVLLRARSIATLLSELNYQYDFPPNIRDELQFIVHFLLNDNDCENKGQEQQQNCLKVYTGESGRPAFVINQIQVEGLRGIGMKWTDIASLLGISVRTLWDKRQLFENFMDMEYSNFSNDELDRLVAEIIANSPNSGETMMIGAIRSRGIKVQRWRVRDAITRVDPIGKVARKLFLVKRRIYSVASPNALW